MTEMTAAAAPSTGARALVAANIRAELARRRVTQKELADRLGWTERQVWRRVNADGELDIDDIVRLARALGVAPSSLMHGIDNEGI